MSGGRKNKLSGKDLLTALEDACRGLVFVSETDSDIEPILADGKRISSLTEFIKERVPISPYPIETKPAQEFFHRLTVDREWHGDAEKNRVRRFRKLEKVIFDNLDDVVVFKVGRIRIEIFIVGYDATGNIAGIKTQAVET